MNSDPTILSGSCRSSFRIIQSYCYKDEHLYASLIQTVAFVEVVIPSVGPATSPVDLTPSLNTSFENCVLEPGSVISNGYWGLLRKVIGNSTVNRICSLGTFLVTLGLYGWDTLETARQNINSDSNKWVDFAGIWGMLGSLYYAGAAGFYSVKGSF